MLKQTIYFFICVLLVSCGQHEQKSEGLQSLSIDEDMEYAAEEMASPSSAATQQRQQSPQPAERKLIKEANITFETKDLEKERARIAEKIKAVNGFVSYELTSKQYDRNSLSLTLRVPSANFDQFISGLLDGVKQIDRKEIRVKDVTEQYVDVAARIRTKKALETRYLGILSKAKSVEEMLEVEKKLNDVRGDIESAESIIKSLSSQIDLSTIDLVIYKRVELVQQKTMRVGFGERLLASLDSGWQAFLEFVLILTNLWVFLAVGIPLTFWLIRLRAKRKNKELER
ncbi:DUF4349 domain-containing protein [Limibacter armeniacum]|uniref:DUF4349 domain-containing protein n=1 Tax=Limibacter armeniacum TaxID=466084 RepID=UPI002FE64772